MVLQTLTKVDLHDKSKTEKAQDAVRFSKIKKEVTKK